MAAALLDQGVVEPADDLLPGGLLHQRQVGDAVAHHVDAHVRGRLVGHLPPDALKDGAQDGKDLDVTVVVDRLDAIGLQVEGIDHVDIAQVHGGSFIGHIDRVAQRQVPDGEGLKLGIPGFDAALHVLIQLRHAYGQLSAARAGRGHQHQGSGGGDVVIFAIALFRHHQGDVGRVARNRVVQGHLDAQAAQAPAEGDSLMLAAPLGDHHVFHQHVRRTEGIDQPQDFLVVGDVQVPSLFILFDIVRADDDDDLRLLTQLRQHFYLAVRPESRQDARSMVVVKQLAAQLQIQLSAKAGHPLTDAFGLGFGVQFMIKACTHAPSLTQKHKGLCP